MPELVRSFLAPCAVSVMSIWMRVRKYAWPIEWRSFVRFRLYSSEHTDSSSTLSEVVR